MAETFHVPGVARKEEAIEQGLDQRRNPFLVGSLRAEELHESVDDESTA